MSLPEAVMNSWNSSTVTAFVDMANELPMATQCCGFANAKPFSAGAEPCLNRPAGSTVMAGHVGQSRITVPGVGTAGDEAAGAGTGARWMENQATTTNASAAAATPAARAITRGFIARAITRGFIARAIRRGFIARPIAPGFQPARRSGAENSATNCLTVRVRSFLSGCRPCTRAEYCGADNSTRCGGGNISDCAPTPASSNGWVPVKSSYARHANA